VLKPLATEQSKAVSAPAPQAVAPDSSVELAYWATIKDSTDKSYFEAYLQQFPTGAFAALARLKIDAIDKRVEAERQAAAKQVAQPPETERTAAATDNAKATEVASLEQPDPLAQSAAGITEPGDLALATQAELARIGCLAGQADGKWGLGSRKALQDYADRQGLKLASLEPTGGLLQRLKAVGERVCPLVCDSGMEAKDSHCQRVGAPGISAFNGGWTVTRRATNKSCGWRKHVDNVSIRNGYVSSGLVEGDVSDDGTVNIVLTFLIDGQRARHIITGKIKGGRGSGKFHDVGGSCAGVIEMARM
jgi:hypothetical protein